MTPITPNPAFALAISSSETPLIDPVAVKSEFSTAGEWFHAQVQPHEMALRAYLRARFNSLTDIDDIIQESYARLLRMSSQDRIKVTRAYLFVIARNAALDLLRRQKVVAFDVLDESGASSVLQEDANAAEQLSRQEELALVTEAINELPSRCREIIVLRRIHELSYAEIARKLGITESTVHAQLCIGLKRCRQYLSDRGVAKAQIRHSNGPA